MRKTCQECGAVIKESTGELVVVLCQLVVVVLVGVVFMVVLLVHLHHPRWCRAWPAWLRPDHSRTVTSHHSVLSEGSDQQHETSRHRPQAGNMLQPAVSQSSTPREKIKKSDCSQENIPHWLSNVHNSFLLEIYSAQNGLYLLKAFLSTILQTFKFSYIFPTDEIIFQMNDWYFV